MNEARGGMDTARSCLMGGAVTKSSIDAAAASLRVALKHIMMASTDSAGSAALQVLHADGDEQQPDQHRPGRSAGTLFELTARPARRSPPAGPARRWRRAAKSFRAWRAYAR